MSTPNPGSAGELYVSITGDISALAQQLDKAQQMSSEAGREISADLGSQLNFDFGEKIATQADTAGESFEQFAQRMRDAAPPAFAFSEAAQEVIDKQAHLEEEFGRTFAALTQVQEGYRTGAASTEELHRATEEMNGAFERAYPEIAHAGEAAHEAGGKFEGMGEALVSIAEKVGIAVGLEEIGREALAAASRVEDLTTSFRLLGASAEEAELRLATIKGIANEVGLEQEKLMSASQRLNAELKNFGDVATVLRTAGDTAKATGTQFETVISSIERLALSGTLGARQLVPLHLKLEDVAAAMGKTSAEAAKAFKDDDITKRVNVLTDALKRFEGAGTAAAGNLSSEFARFHNQMDETFEALGKGLGPIAGAMASAFGDLLEAVRPVVSEIAELAASPVAGTINEVRESAHGLAAAIAEIPLGELSHGFETVNAKVLELTHAPLSAWLKQAAVDVFATETGFRALSATMQGISGNIQAAIGHSTAMDQAIQKMLEHLVPAGPALTATGDAARGFSEGLEKLIAKQEKANEALASAKAVLAEAKAALDAGKISQETYNDALKAYEQALTSAEGKASKITAEQKELARAMEELRLVPPGIADAMNAMAHGVNLEELNKKIDTFIKKIQEMSGVGTKETDAVIAALANAKDKLQGFADSGADATQKIIDAQKKADDQAKQSKIALDALTLSYQNQVPLLTGHVATLAEVERAQHSYNSALSAAGQSGHTAAAGIAAVGAAATQSSHGVIDVDLALRGATTAFQDTAAKGLLAAGTLSEGLQNIAGATNKLVDVLDSAGNKTQVLVSGFHDAQDSGDKLGATIIDLTGILDGSESTLASYGVTLKEIASDWDRVDAAASAAGSAMSSASGGGGGRSGRGGGGGSDLMSGSALEGMSGKSMGLLEYMLTAAAFGNSPMASTGVGGQDALSRSFDQMGYSYNGVGGQIMAQWHPDQSIGIGFLKQLEGVGLSADAASRTLIDLEVQAGKTGKSLDQLVKEYIANLQQSLQKHSDTVAHAGTVMTTYSGKLDNLVVKTADGTTAMASLPSAIAAMGQTVYNADAHLEDLVKGITNADAAFWAASTHVTAATVAVGAAAQATMSVAQVAAQSAGVVLSAARAANLPVPVTPTISGSTLIPAIGAANQGTLGTPGGVQIYVTGNAITSLDSAQRLSEIMVHAMRNQASLKL